MTDGLAALLYYTTFSLTRCQEMPICSVKTEWNKDHKKQKVTSHHYYHGASMFFCLGADLARFKIQDSRRLYLSRGKLSCNSSKTK